MKKVTSKKKSPRKSPEERPLELDRSWTDLEQQHDRIKMDWGALAAQLGVSAGEDE